MSFWGILGWGLLIWLFVCIIGVILLVRFLGSKITRIIAFVIGLILVFLGGVTLAITTIPGVALIIWAITGYLPKKLIG